MNFKVRFKNPIFIVQLLLAIILPILSYAGLTAQDITTWDTLGNLLLGAVKNPYILCLVASSVWACLNDPTTAGIKDSDQAMTYDKPRVSR